MKVFLFILSFFYLLSLPAQHITERYSTIAITFADFEKLQSDYTHGLPLDHFHKNEQQLLEFVLSETELQELTTRGINYQVIIEDYQSHFQQLLLQNGQNRSADCGLTNFDEGDMGGYHTFDQMLSHILSMEFHFPELVEVNKLGMTHDNHPIFVVKISDNVLIDESEQEGVVYFDALHHAREPMSLEVTLYYMWWLLENYNDDPEAAYLVDHREMYFVPVANPDGYLYNESTNPNGGGLWRKNRRNSGNGCFGVDLNRNYSYGWGLDTGSSDNPCTNTYRGEMPFSEPETQAISSFIETIQPAIAFTNHTYGDKFLSPWGYVDSLASYELYAEFVSEFIPQSYDGYGTTSRMLNYTSSGTTRDYLHSEGILAWTPEIGHSFWESPGVICERVNEFLEPMKYLSWVCGAYACFHDFTLHNNRIWMGDTIAFDIRVKNRGLTKSANGVRVEATSDHPGINSIQSTIIYGNIESRQFKSNPGLSFQFQLTDEMQVGEIIPFNIDVYQEEMLAYNKTIYLRAGETNVLYQTDFENELDWLDTNMNWDTTSMDAMSGLYSFADSPFDNYDSNSSRTSGLTEPVDLSEVNYPLLTFNSKWSLEPFFDAVTLLASTDGANWEPLPGWYTDGALSFNQNQHWVQEFIDLTGFSGEPQVYFAFHLETDNSVHSDGFYVDDFKIIDLTVPEEMVSAKDIFNPGQKIKAAILPNPSFGQAHLVVNSTEFLNSEIRVFAANGALELQQSMVLKEGENRLLLETESLGAGIYLLQLHTQASLDHLKLVIVK